MLQLDQADVNANFAMYELEQIAGNIPKALQHQRTVLQRQTLFSEYAPQEQRRILALLAPGDWQANVPIDFLIDRRTTTMHKLYIDSAQQIAAAVLPQADVVFTAIGESEENVERLHLASAIVKHEVARRLGLDYFGIDCSIDREGRLVIFEADPAVLVHAGDDPELLGYKLPYAKRIFDAFERLIDRARSR